MNALGDIRRAPVAPPRGDALTQPGDGARWVKALAIVLAVHALPVVIAAYWLGPPVIVTAPEPAILIDMAPAAAPVAPSERPPGPEQVQAETPRPVVEREVVETPPVPNPAVTLPPQPPTPPKVEVRRPTPETPTRQTPAPETTAPPSRPSPPAQRASSGQANWQGLVLGALDRVKRYPREAQFNRQQGTPYIRFVMNRDGRVLSSRLERSSGFASLDREAVALPHRAQPLPRPPDDVTGQTIELVVPVEFFMR